MHASNFVDVSFVELHLGRLLLARGDLSGAERFLRTVVENCRTGGQAAWAYEASIHLADCLIRSGRPDEGLVAVARPANLDPAEVAIFEAASSAVSARGLLALGRHREAIEQLCHGVALARRESLLFDLARLLSLADEMGPPFDSRLGTAEPADEVVHIAGRLGLVSHAFP